MIKTIIFDLGDVYVSVDGPLQLSRKYNLPVDEVEKAVEEEYMKCATSKEKSRQFWIWFKDKFKIDDSVENIRKVMVQSISLIKGTFELVKKLKKNGYKVLFLSNSHIDTTPQHKKQYKFHKQFDGGLFSHEHEFFKPDKRFYEQLLRETKSEPEECVYIDDREANLKPAKELGMKVILFRNPEQLNEELEKLGVKHESV